MLQVLEAQPHVARLLQLQRRFRAEASSLYAVLADLQTELEASHRESARLRLTDGPDADRLANRCSALQQECDDVAIELAHVRLAVSGVEEELYAHRHGQHPADPIDSVA